MSKRLIFLLVISTILVILPILLKATTIYDVQYNETNRGTGDDCYPSPEENNTVTITGVVTGVTTNTSYDNFWIQEASGLWHGIYVFDNSIHPSRGDSITLTGMVSEYYGLTEIDPGSYQIHATGRPEPEPIKVTSADLAGGCSALGESFEGVLVRIEKVVVTEDLNQYGEWYVSDDGGVTECQIDDKCFPYDPTVGEAIESITGVVTYDFEKYEINPRDMDDIGAKGIGVATITPDTVDFATSNISEKVAIRSDSVGITLTKIEIDIPSDWVWRPWGPMAVNLSGSGFPDTALIDTTESDSSRIIILKAAIDTVNSGTVEITNLASPVYPDDFTFRIKTAYNNRELAPIRSSPKVYVRGAEKPTLTVPPHPFAPDLGERLEIRFTSPADNYMVLKLFDLEGRVVKTLFDGLSSGDMKTVKGIDGEEGWDGRNELFERVPIGVYILYLETTDRQTGKTTTAKAPIVVGTRLK